MDLSSPVLEATRVRLVARFGAAVGPWWERMPRIVDELAERWALVVENAVGRGNTSIVLRCRRSDGRRAILKLAPDAAVARGEAHALRAWAPSGRVPLVWGYDGAHGALLLEAIADETPVAERGRPLAVAEVAELICALHGAGRPVLGDGSCRSPSASSSSSTTRAGAWRWTRRRAGR